MYIQLYNQLYHISRTHIIIIIVRALHLLAINRCYPFFFFFFFLINKKKNIAPDFFYVMSFQPRVRRDIPRVQLRENRRCTSRQPHDVDFDFVFHFAFFSLVSAVRFFFSDPHCRVSPEAIRCKLSFLALFSL